MNQWSLYKSPLILCLICVGYKHKVEMNETEKAIDRKVTRMEHEFQDIVIKTEYLKTTKVKVKKDIEFYKAAINKLAFIYDISPE